jgi:bifunctional non-homologous end joining protein LigD
MNIIWIGIGIQKLLLGKFVDKVSQEYSSYKREQQRLFPFSFDLFLVGYKYMLKIYKSKRDFKKTSEPSGSSQKKKSKKPVFVVQKHQARALHYDFRLEVDGVLKSWAVPKGPSKNSKDKRLAVMTEDHPIEYATFAGDIPAGEYGGGKVEIWDSGTYESEKSMKTALRDGTVEVNLSGKKLKGMYALVRTNMGGSKKNWLLIKMKE